MSSSHSLVASARFVSFVVATFGSAVVACAVTTTPSSSTDVDGGRTVDAGAGATSAPAIDGGLPAPGMPTGELERQLYTGTWAYQPGSALIIACPSQPATLVDLSHAAPDGTAGTFDITLTTSGLHEVDGLGCEDDFVIEDHAATSSTPQTCTRFPDGKGGFVLRTTDVTHKTTRDGHAMYVAAHGKVGSAQDCELFVEGYALKTGSAAPPMGPPAMPEAGPPATGMGGPSAGPERDRYVGGWSYAKGSALVLACPGQPARVTDLFTVNGGKPGGFLLSALGAEALHEVDGLGCQYDVAVVDGSAFVSAGQTCAQFPDGTGGSTLLTTEPLRKTSWDGVHMVVAGRAKVGAEQQCDLLVSGVASR